MGATTYGNATSCRLQMLVFLRHMQCFIHSYWSGTFEHTRLCPWVVDGVKSYLQVWIMKDKDSI